MPATAPHPTPSPQLSPGQDVHRHTPGAPYACAHTLVFALICHSLSLTCTYAHTHAQVPRRAPSVACHLVTHPPLSSLACKLLPLAHSGSLSSRTPSSTPFHRHALSDRQTCLFSHSELGLFLSRNRIPLSRAYRQASALLPFRALLPARLHPVHRDCGRHWCFPASSPVHTHIFFFSFVHTPFHMVTLLSCSFRPLYSLYYLLTIAQTHLYIHAHTPCFFVCRCSHLQETRQPC